MTLLSEIGRFLSRLKVAIIVVVVVVGVGVDVVHVKNPERD